MAIFVNGGQVKVQKLSPMVTSYPFTIYFRARYNSLSFGHMLSQNNTGSNVNYFYTATSGVTYEHVIRDNGGTQAIIHAGTPDLNWHSFFLVHSASNSHKLYIDGVLAGSNSTNVGFPSAQNATYLGHFNRPAGAGSGFVDMSEYASWSSVISDDKIRQISGGIKGTVLGADDANLIVYLPLDDHPDTQNIDGSTFRDLSGNNNSFTGDDAGSPSDLLSLAEPVMSYDSEIIIPSDPLGFKFLNFEDTFVIGENFDIHSNAVDMSESVIISDNFILTPTAKLLDINETVQISDTIESSVPQDAPFAIKIISINPLMFVTNDNPAKISKIDISDPENPSPTTAIITGITTAQDVSVNSSNSCVYIAGTDGKVVKIEIADLNNQTIIDLSDTDDILTVETNSNFGITYAGTENGTGELYVIDERDTFLINTDFQVLSSQTFELESNFYITNNFKIDSDFKVLSEARLLLDSDFKCITKPAVPPPPSINPLDVIEPIKLTDFQVFIDSVELEDTDLILDSITITHSVGEESRASFIVCRKHDQLNTTAQGNSVIITNQNTVEIKIQGTTEFLGNISELDCQYNSSQDLIQVNCFSSEKNNQFNNVTMSLPSLNSRLSLYDILIQNPQIFNPVIDPDNEEDPKKYKGIRVDLGTKIEQSLSRWRILDNIGSIADDIQAGTFNPLQNWTYFWSPTVTKFGNVKLGEIGTLNFLYIGTSLAPVSADLWDLNIATHWRQRIHDDIETELGFYEIGEAPFKDISVRNGVKIAKLRLVDEPSRLSSIKDIEYNFVDYAKLVAELEYENLKNINGNILPDTSCTFNITIDGYLYYDISLSTRINVDNTTQSNIYKNNNGFPVSVKSITITSFDRRVNIQADNSKSVKDLEEINGLFPDEDSDEYNTPETRTLIALKTDMRTRLKVQ